LLNKFQVRLQIRCRQCFQLTGLGGDKLDQFRRFLYGGIAFKRNGGRINGCFGFRAMWIAANGGIQAKNAETRLFEPVVCVQELGK